MRRSLRLIAALLVVGAVGFGASSAFGTTGSSTAGALSFTLSVPDSVTKGQTFTWTGSVTNTSPSLASDAYVKVVVAGPNGFTRQTWYQLHLAPNQSLTRGSTMVVPALAPAGSYTVTLTLQSPQNGAGQTSATSTVS